MSEHPPVSIVVSTMGQRDAYLREAVDSFLDQDYPGDITVIISYDKSEPDENWVEERPGRRVRVVKNERTSGLPGSRNAGIMAADTDLVAFCDDDDLYLPGKIGAQVAALQASPTSAAVFCGQRVFREDSDWTVEQFHPEPHLSLDDLLRRRHAVANSVTLMVRRSALLEEGIGMFAEDIPGGYGEDYEMLLRLARHSPVLSVADVHVLIRVNPNSYFTKRWEMISEALEWLLAQFPEYEKVPRGYARISGQIAFAQAALRNRKSAFRWAWKTFRASPFEPRTYVVTVMAARLLTPEFVQKRLQAFGYGF
jgi:glycosyltransferase involved in cell wall biosynthesis